MTMILSGGAESVRNRIRNLRLPRPLNIFLFGFDNTEPEVASPPAEAADIESQSASVPAPKRRGTKPQTAKISLEEIAERVEEWSAKHKIFPAEVSADQLAEEIDVPRNLLIQCFSIHIRMDFRRWKMEKKIACAKKMLRDRPEILATDIAVCCGFNNPSNFFRQFKRITGCTPQEWRND